MKIRYFIILLFISLGCENKIQKHPNVVLIMMDDMNDYPEVFDGHPMADNEGFIYKAPVDVEEEYVDMLEASRQYQNNVEVITTIKALMLKTANMGK